MAKAGSRWGCTVCGGQVVVTRATEREIACCGQLMVPAASGGPAGPAAAAGGLQLGKRYRCPACGGEALVTRAGVGPLQCHEEMVLQAPKQLATSD